MSFQSSPTRKEVPHLVSLPGIGAAIWLPHMNLLLKGTVIACWCNVKPDDIKIADSRYGEKVWIFEAHNGPK